MEQQSNKYQKRIVNIQLEEQSIQKIKSICNKPINAAETKQKRKQENSNTHVTKTKQEHKLQSEQLAEQDPLIFRDIVNYKINDQYIADVNQDKYQMNKKIINSINNLNQKPEKKADKKNLQKDFSEALLYPKQKQTKQKINQTQSDQRKDYSEKNGENNKIRKLNSLTEILKQKRKGQYLQQKWNKSNVKKEANSQLIHSNNSSTCQLESLTFKSENFLKKDDFLGQDSLNESQSDQQLITFIQEQDILITIPGAENLTTSQGKEFEVNNCQNRNRQIKEFAFDKLEIKTSIEDLDEDLELHEIQIRKSQDYKQNKENNNSLQHAANEPYLTMSMNSLKDKLLNKPTIQMSNESCSFKKNSNLFNDNFSQNMSINQCQQQQNISQTSAVQEKEVIQKDEKASPKYQQPKKNLDWMNLLDEALQFERSSDISDEENPEKPNNIFPEQINDFQKENANLNQVNHNKLIELEILSDNLLSKQTFKTKSEQSEGITDHGGSPLKQNDPCNLDNQIFEKGFNSLLNLQKNHYDPHEPHSALNKEIESLTNNQPNDLDSKNKQNPQINQDRKFDNSISPQINNQLLLNFQEDDNLEADVSYENNLINLQKLSQDQDQESFNFNIKNENQFNNEQFVYKKIINDDDLEDEIQLVDDGYFDKFMKSQNINSDKQQINSQERPFQNQYYFNNFQQNPKQQYVESRQVIQNYSLNQNNLNYPVYNPNLYFNLNNQINNQIEKNYFPKFKEQFDIFQNMLKKEQKIQERVKIEKGLSNNQKEISQDMRITLIDWMCQVASDYCLKRQTFHISVQILDYFIIHSDQIIQTHQFQLLGVTCLHVAAKFEEIYPPHIKSFAESTNDSVSIQDIINMEQLICSALTWNINQFQTIFQWATWFMNRWDSYVEEQLQYLKLRFQLKFYEKSPQSSIMFQTIIQIMDIAQMNFKTREYPPRTIIACIMYLIIGGKDIMCVFKMEYNQMISYFQNVFPIPNFAQINMNQNIYSKIPESFLFYNQIIQPFFVTEFDLNLQDLIEPLQYVLQFFNLEIDQQQHLSLEKQCLFNLQQYQEIALEKFQNFKNYRTYPQLEMKENTKVESNINELYSFQTYNTNYLDTLKLILNNDQVQSFNEIYVNHNDELNENLEPDNNFDLQDLI